MVCATGGICRDGRCQCPDECDQHLRESVCANNGQTYVSECELRRHACLNELNLSPVYFGECESRAVLAKPRVNEVDNSDLSMTNYGHHGPTPPTDVTEAVVGSGDGALTDTDDSDEDNDNDLTDPSRQQFDYNQLNQHNRICVRLKCGDYGAVCRRRTTTDHRPNCDCDAISCDAKTISSSMSTMGKVCADSGQLYDSECEMRRDACRLQRKLSIVDGDRCGLINVIGKSEILYLFNISERSII